MELKEIMDINDVAIVFIDFPFKAFTIKFNNYNHIYLNINGSIDDKYRYLLFEISKLKKDINIDIDVFETYIKNIEKNGVLTCQ